MLCAVFNAKFICQRRLVYLNVQGAIYKSSCTRSVDEILAKKLGVKKHCLNMCHLQ
jgi:hypothetical protein